MKYVSWNWKFKYSLKQCYLQIINFATLVSVSLRNVQSPWRQKWYVQFKVYLEVPNSCPAKTTDIYLAFVLATLTLGICIIGNNILLSSVIATVNANAIENVSSAMCSSTSQTQWPRLCASSIPTPFHAYLACPSRSSSPYVCCPDEFQLPAPWYSSALSEDHSNVGSFCCVCVWQSALGSWVVKIDSIGFVVIRSKV